MKEIGQKLKSAREDIGVSIEEVAEDLKIRPSQIENIESGNKEAFEDIFYLKYFIRDYAKYLGLNKDDLVDEFNEYLFDYTSKLSLDDIKNAKKEKKPTRVIKSPYTIDKKRKLSIVPFLVYALIVILVVSIIYFIVTLNSEDDEFVEGTVITEGEQK
ncbi:MAG: helix-turn-helix domain-containing protein [Bacilli bacterium]|nr:helix-turn-helix domain-containing protein [Bacilli bacterium]